MDSSGTTRRNAWIGIGIIGAAIAIWGIIAVLVSREMWTIPQHHLLHAGMAFGAGLLAMALAALLPSTSRERGWWCIVAVLAPTATLFLMWPTAYMYLMSHPWLHFLDHLGIAVLSFLAVFGAQAYVRGLGWPMLVLLIGMDAAAAGGFGVTHHPQPLATDPPPPAATMSMPSSSMSAMPGHAGP